MLAAAARRIGLTLAAVLCAVTAAAVTAAAVAEAAVTQLPAPHLAVASARAVCFGYSAKAVGVQGSDGGYRKLLVSFTATGLVRSDAYTLVAERQYKGHWVAIGAGISFGFRASTSTYTSHEAPVTSVYAEDALSIPHVAFPARFTLSNYGRGNDVVLMNEGKLKAGISSPVTAMVTTSPAATCPRKLP